MPEVEWTPPSDLLCQMWLEHWQSEVPEGAEEGE